MAKWIFCVFYGEIWTISLHLFSLEIKISFFISKNGEIIKRILIYESIKNTFVQFQAIQ